eukprot:1156446-Pelagomonas_calceolata.AAC.11
MDGERARHGCAGTGVSQAWMCRKCKNGVSQAWMCGKWSEQSNGVSVARICREWSEPSMDVRKME